MGQRVAYVEAPSGIAGDMLLGALVDLGLPVAVLEDVATRLGVDGLSVRAERVDKNGLSAVQVDVLLGGRRVGAAAHAHDKEHTHDHDHAHSHEHTHDHGDEPHEDRASSRVILCACRVGVREREKTARADTRKKSCKCGTIT